jgi:hypothetical protein
MNINSDEFDIRKINDKKLKTLLKQRDDQIKELEKKKNKNGNFLELKPIDRKEFKKKTSSLYYDFSKAVEKLPLKYTNEEIEDAMKKLKQLILMRQFLKPYREEFIFSAQNFLSTENDDLEDYRRIILDNINGLTEQSFTDLETNLGIENFDNIPNKRFSRNSSRSPGRKPIRSPGPSSKNNNVKLASIDSSAGTSQNTNYISVSPNPSSGSKKRKKHKKKRNKGTVKGRTNEKKKKTEIKGIRR